MPLPAELLNRKRIEMSLAKLGVPEVPVFGRYNHARAEHGLPEHEHEEIVEICYLIKGRQTYRVGGRDYAMRGGDVFLTFPGEKHSSAGGPQEKGVLYWMMVRRAGDAFLGLPSSQSDRLWRSLRRLPQRHFRGSARMKEHMDTLTRLANDGNFPLRRACLISECLALLLEVLRCAERHQDSPSAGKMEAVYRHIEDHIEEAMSVPELAALSGLSVPRFKARFKAETGVPPAEYVLRAKIAEARKRLATGRESITTIAYALSFSSSQYFATVFKRFTGQTPRAVTGGQR